MSKKRLQVLVILLICFLACGSLLAQTRESATIEGTVKDEEGSPLPGVAVTASSSSILGTPSAISDENGRYRIPALLTGTYTIEATLEGFNPSRVENIVLHVGMTATINIILIQTKLKAEVVVVGAAPMVDVTDASLATTYITQDLLSSLPTARNVQQAINVAPGITELSAYGGSDEGGNSWAIDGAEISSSGWGSVRYEAIIDYSIVEEMQIMGLGAPAEFSGFTGAAINIVTKSGGNSLSGDIQVYGRGKTWQSSNVDKSDPVFSLIGETPTTDFFDASAHIGGPIIKDKLWFFAGFQYYKSTTTMESLGKVSPSKLPKQFIKLSFQLTQNDRIQAFFENHRNTSDNFKFSPNVMPEANMDRVWGAKIANLSYLHIFPPNTILELKLSYKKRQQDQAPSSRDSETPGHYDLGTGITWGNATYWSVNPDEKFSLRTSFSHDVEDLLGSHNFKLGVDFEQGSGMWENNTPGGFTYYDLNGEPNFASAYHGYQSYKIRHLSFYVQDDWKLTEFLVINPGLRFSIQRGTVPGLEGYIWKPKMGLEPRLGIVYDISKNQETVLKAHYGKYYAGMKGYNYWEITPTGDETLYKVPEWGTLEYWYTIPGEDLYVMDPNLKAPSMSQLAVGIEQILGKDVAVGASVIYKKWKDFVDRVNIAATFEEVQFTDPASGKVYTVYQQTNLGSAQYLITNPTVGADIGAAYPGIVQVEPTRKYVGFQLTFNKRFSNNWQLSASYTYGKEEGSYSNTQNTGLAFYGVGGTSNYLNPTAQINLYGRSPISPPHVFKIMGTYILPWDISLSAFYTYYSGRRWTKAIYCEPAQTTLMLEPQGSQRLPNVNNLDLRMEKTFNFQKKSFALMLDLFNLFNQSRATSVNQYEGTTQGMALVVCDPRTFRIGARFSF